MRLGTLLFGAFAVIMLVVFSYPAYVVFDQLRIVYLESAEEPLVDTANVLAEVVGQQMERDAFDADAFHRVFDRVAAREVDAWIYEMRKADVDLDVYVTDAEGVVIFDTREPGHVGEPYAKWRDVQRTLDGLYGARISSNPADPTLPRLLYVAAPVRVRGALAGVLTVIKPTTSIRAFLDVARPRLVWLGVAALATAIMLALLVSLWLTREVGRLTAYADDVRAGRRVAFPELAKTELLDLGLAVEKMRESLAGQAYVEQYVRALTHEIKSPISAIRGAAEILETPDVDAATRARFLQNIQHETERVRDLVDRMLELSELEVRRALPERTSVALGALARTIAEHYGPNLSRKSLALELDVPDDLAVEGDAFLLHLALSNLVKNAIEFSPSSGRILLAAVRDDAGIRLTVEDEGPGIQDFAKARIFERFYSLERPDTRRKSTGLGLNFVKEVADLHHGTITLDNRPEGGLRAVLTLPAR